MKLALKIAVGCLGAKKDGDVRRGTAMAVDPRRAVALLRVEKGEKENKEKKKKKKEKKKKKHKKKKKKKKKKI